MTNTAKARGTRFETAVVAYLNANGYPNVERRALHGTNDKGDIAGLPLVIEVKNAKEYRLGPWMDEADVEAANAGVELGVVWAHRRGKASAGDGFVVMSGATFTSLIKSAGY